MSSVCTAIELNDLLKSGSTVAELVEGLQGDYHALSKDMQRQQLREIMSVPDLVDYVADIVAAPPVGRVIVEEHTVGAKTDRTTGKVAPAYQTIRIQVDGRYWDSCRPENFATKFAYLADSDLVAELVSKVSAWLDNPPAPVVPVVPVVESVSDRQDKIRAAERQVFGRSAKPAGRFAR